MSTASPNFAAIAGLAVRYSFMTQLASENPNEVEAAAVELQRLGSVSVSGDKLDDFCEECHSAKVIPALAVLLSKSPAENIQIQAFWTLTNIASSNKAKFSVAMTEAGLVPVAVQAMKSSNRELASQACWFISNLAGNGAEFRDVCLEANALPAIVAQLEAAETDQKMKDTASWGLSNLCRFKPWPSYTLTNGALVPAFKLVQSTEVSRDVLKTSMWVLTALAHTGKPELDALMKTSSLPMRLLGLLKEETAALIQNPEADGQILLAVLQLLSAMFTNGDDIVAIFLQLGILEPLITLLGRNTKIKKSHVLSVFTGILAGPENFITKAIESQAIPLIVGCVQSGVGDAKKNAAVCLANVCSGASAEQVLYLVDNGVIVPLTQTLTLDGAPDSLITSTLNAIRNLLKAGWDWASLQGESVNIYNEAFLGAGAQDALKTIAQNPNDNGAYAARLLADAFGVQVSTTGSALSPAKPFPAAADEPASTDPLALAVPLSEEDYQNPTQVLQVARERVLHTDPEVQKAGVIVMRKLLSREKNPPIDAVLATGVVPTIVRIARDTKNQILQFEALWTITNIASGTLEHSKVIVDMGVIPIGVKGLLSSNYDVSEQSAWLLGNIAGNGVDMRDICLKAGALKNLIKVLEFKTGRLSLIRTATWVLSNLCRGKPQPALKTVQPALSTLAKLIYSTDEEVCTDAAWAIFYISDGPNERQHAVIETGCTRRLVELLSSRNSAVVLPCLQAIGNIMSGDDIATEVAINCGALPALRPLLQHTKQSIRKQVFFALSNVLAGPFGQIQQVIDAGVMPGVLECAMKDRYDVRKEAAWCIANFFSGDNPDTSLVDLSLDGIERALKIGDANKDGTNVFVSKIEEFEGEKLLLRLAQEHDNAHIVEKANRILAMFFPNADASGPTLTADGSSFVF